MKNSFASAKYIEQKILDEEWKVVGTVRLKPTAILWKGKSGRKFHSVSLQQFAEWITDPATKARQTES